MTTIYWMDTSSLDWETLLPTVPLWRREKIERFRFDRDKRLSLGAALLLRQCGLDDTVAYTEHGKPYFPRRADVRFSISHSVQYAVCAISDREVGCDVERIDPRHLSIARQCLTEREQKALSDADDPARVFTRLWTAKESVMKCTGLGFTLPPREIEIDLENGCWKEYRIGEYDIIEGYCLALCMKEGEAEQARIVRITK